MEEASNSFVAVSLPHVAIEKGAAHSGVALRSAEGLWWVTEGMRIGLAVDVRLPR